MKKVGRIISLLALVGTIVPAVMFFNGRADLADVKSWMLVSTVVWFAITPMWMERTS